jgi:hypothetical protein
MRCAGTTGTSTESARGEVVRVAREGIWAYVRYPTQSSMPFPDVTCITRRVRITNLHIVKHANEPPTC